MGTSSRNTLDRAFRYDIGLKGNKVKVSLSPYAQLALAKTGELTNIQSLSGHHVSYFGQNTRAWKQIQEALDQGNLTVDPALSHRADEALRDAALVSTPLFPVPPQMRLGWLTDLDRIPCKKDDPERGYEAGRKYPLSTRSKVASETEERVVEKKNRRAGAAALRHRAAPAGGPHRRPRLRREQREHRLPGRTLRVARPGVRGDPLPGEDARQPKPPRAHSP